MPPKKKVDLPDHVRAAVLADVELTHQQAEQAAENDKIRIYLALEQGLTTRELEAELGVPQQTLSRWGRLGKELLERREEARKPRESARSRPAGQDPDGSAEREPHS